MKVVEALKSVLGLIQARPPLRSRSNGQVAPPKQLKASLLTAIKLVEPPGATP